jgi:hypothetical protein
MPLGRIDNAFGESGDGDVTLSRYIGCRGDIAVVAIGLSPKTCYSRTRMENGFFDPDRR